MSTKKNTTTRSVPTSEAKGQGSIGIGLSSAAFRASDAIPESRMFNDPDADQDPLRGLRGLHVDGEPIEEWSKGMTDAQLSKLGRFMTDEGMVENQRIARNQAADDSMRLPLGGVARDPFEKKVKAQDDFLEDGQNDPLLAPNPMQEIVNRYKEPGFAYKFLSERVNRQMGTRGYQIVTDSEGNPVKMADLTLAKIPERIANARQKKDAQESQESINSAQDTYTESVARLQRDARDLGLRVLEPGEMSGDFHNTETGRTVNIGG